jgi:SAM-dependent methyltransferase
MAMADVAGGDQGGHGGPVRRPGDVVFSAAAHLQLLMRVDRTQGLRRAIALAIKPGARVLDAGCGSGLLSFLALEAGAAAVVAVDRDNIELARALARANGHDAHIRFIEADLGALTRDQLPERFDALLACVYTNHIIVDEPRARMVTALRDKFGAPGCVTVPNRVRYWAIACDWPEIDGLTELAELRHAVEDLEARYALKLGPLLEAVSAELLFTRTRPQIAGERSWMAGPTQGGFKYRRGGARFLGARTPVAEIAYDSGASAPLPARLALEIHAPGTLNAVMWGQELWFDDFLIWSSEAFSPLAVPVAVRTGERWGAALDHAWRSSNALTAERLA